jgi:hypothetical protein
MSLKTGLAIAGLSLASLAAQTAGRGAGAIALDADDIGGTVTGPAGPEAGVWVIAETNDLPTKFVRIVVTDDAGRYVVPDLPAANYTLFVRGYGLVDSPKVPAARGTAVDLKATAAPTPRAAAAIYPAGYWLSLIHVPAKNEFPGTGPAGNGISPNLKSQGDWIRLVKSGGCMGCHQLGSRGTRTIPKELGVFPTSKDAWQRRIMSGQAGPNMLLTIAQFGNDRALSMFADWTDRIAAGEVPATPPPRPQGIERNVVITEWDWAGPTVYLHDQVSTDRRNPRVNAGGPLYGSMELSADYLPVLNPATNTTGEVRLKPRDPETPMTPALVMRPSAYWGDEVIWNSQTNVHNPMLDADGRVWITSTIRPAPNPKYCMDGSVPSSKLFPLETSGRQLAMYDPKTKALTHISTCFGTHHLMFAEDANNTLWTSGGGPVVGWLDTKMFDRTHDEKKSQGWTALVMDTNGNGKRDSYTEPDQPLDPTKDRRFVGGLYAIAPAPDGSVWGTVMGYPGAIVRISPGAHPPDTALAEVFEPPLPGYSPRGGDVDRDGVYWVALASGHLGSFDRRKCKGPLNGPTATGQHCPEGWTMYPEPLPQLQGVTDSGSAEGSYYTWVDQFDTLGLGKNTPIDTGNGSEGLLVLKDGKWVVLRVPYPNGFYAKWMDGRIDDPAAGWKGRGIYTTIGSRAPFHMETGKGTTSKVLHFQLRPDPLAK